MQTRISLKLILAISSSHWCNVQVSRTLHHWEPEIAGIKSKLMLAYVLPFLASIGPDFQSNSNGTTYLIFQNHPEKIFVYSGLSHAIKVAISDQFSLYCMQSLLRHTLHILPRPDFLCHSDSVLHIEVKVLCGNVHQHLALAVQSMFPICFWGANIQQVYDITRTRSMMLFQWCTQLGNTCTPWERMAVSLAIVPSFCQNLQ